MDEVLCFMRNELYIDYSKQKFDVMEIIKMGRKYLIKGDEEGWVFNKNFPTKWKAEIALEVFKDGGSVQDYWKRKKHREENPIHRNPTRAIQILEKALDEIRELGPTCDEIIAFSEVSSNWTHSRSKSYHSPRLHNTWGYKKGGRVHIDLGCAGIHVMLTKECVYGFIDFIKDERSSFD